MTDEQMEQLESLKAAAFDAAQALISKSSECNSMMKSQQEARSLRDTSDRAALKVLQDARSSLSKAKIAAEKAIEDFKDSNS